MAEACPEATDLAAVFERPPDACRPVPFWWWVGEPLERERLRWQLDQLKARGVLGAVISYNHLPDGRNNPASPAVFSEGWWEIFRWALAECRQRGMTLAFQDYTLIGPILAEIGRSVPGMAGGELCERHASAGESDEVVLQCPEGCEVVTARAWPRGARAGARDGSESTCSRWWKRAS